MSEGNEPQAQASGEARSAGHGTTCRWLLLMALGSPPAPVAAAAATSVDGSAGARKRVGGGGGPRETRWTSCDGDDASAVDSLYEFRNGKFEAEMGGRTGSGKQWPPPPGPPRLLNLATVLTIGRVVAVPIIVSTFYMDGWWGTSATTITFLVAAITDWLDGYLARKMRLGTAFGAFLDPVADKLMVAATMVLLCTKPLKCAIFRGFPWLLTAPSIVIICREITMSAVREWAASQNQRVLVAVAVNSLGKWKTATQMTSLTLLLASRDHRLTENSVLVALGVVLLYMSAVLAVWSLVVYLRKIGRSLLK